MKLIIFSLKRSSFFLFLLFLAVLPFSSFAVYMPDYVPAFAVSLYRFKDNSDSTVSSYFICSSQSSAYTLFASHPFCFAFRPSNNLITPSIPASTNLNATSSNYANCIQYYNNNGRWGNPRLIPSIDSLYVFAASLVSQGYRGDGLKIVYTNSVDQFVNFDYKLVVADILSSTNSVFRQILLGHLNTIQQSVANIEVNMTGVQAAVEQGNTSLSNINVSVSDIRDVAVANLAAVSNISESAFFVSSNSVDILRGVDLLHDDWLASSIDVFLGDDTDAWVNFLDVAVEQGLLSESDASQYASTLRATDPTRKKSYSIPDAHRRFFAKNSIKGTVVEAQQMRGRYQTFRNWTNQRGEMFGAMDFTWNAVAGDRINSIMGAHVDDWRQELRQQLQDWKTSDEHGILNVKKSIEDNFSIDDPRIPGQSNSLPYTVFVTNYVTRPLTNSIDQAASLIVTNDAAQAQATRDFLNDNLFSPDAQGAYVRIKFPLYQEHGPAVHVHDTALDVFGVGIDEINYNLARMLDNFDSRWETWFRLWGDWSSPVATNIEDILYVLLNWTNTTVQLDHVLFYDYSNYVHSASYDDLFSTLENDYPVCYSNLVKFGLSSSEDGGRWWNVLASSASYDTAMLSYVFNDMVELDRIAHDSLGKSPFSFLRETLSDMPSKSQIENYVSQASNATFQITGSLASLSNSLNSVSNSYVSVFNPFRGHFDSPGASVTFFKLYDGRGGRYVTIPVSDRADAWRYIRLGVSFGLVAVNILLFPKYLLMLFTLFIKAYRIGIKFFPDDL